MLINPPHSALHGVLPTVVGDVLKIPVAKASVTVEKTTKTYMAIEIINGPRWNRTIKVGVLTLRFVRQE